MARVAQGKSSGNTLGYREAGPPASNPGRPPGIVAFNLNDGIIRKTECIPKPDGAHQLKAFRPVAPTDCFVSVGPHDDGFVSTDQTALKLYRFVGTTHPAGGPGF